LQTALGYHSLLIFRLRPHRFYFRVKESVFFPPAKAGNVLRGALGAGLSQLTAPASTSPAGFLTPPRPFVFRAAHLDGKRIEGGECFDFEINIFDLRRPVGEIFTRIFSGWATAGLGPRRGRVDLISVAAAEEIRLHLTSSCPASKCSLAFRTPTDLKGSISNKGITSNEELPFDLLFARVRDRISALQTIYGETPLAIDFRALAERASRIRSVRGNLRRRSIERRSSRTGQTHDIGGVTGEVDYEGDLTEFLPWLKAAWWTGVGRHTVWGNGVIEVVHFE
jgi:CRISPR-associated endoribonuclease Cas6